VDLVDEIFAGHRFLHNSFRTNMDSETGLNGFMMNRKTSHCIQLERHTDEISKRFGKCDASQTGRWRG